MVYFHEQITTRLAFDRLCGLVEKSELNKKCLKTLTVLSRTQLNHPGEYIA